MPTTDINALKTANADRWGKANPTRNFSAVARSLIDPTAKAHYKAVSAKTGVPWYVIAVIHERESGQRWSGNLANGQPWTQKTTIVPKDRGPYNSWDESAVDALVNCPPFASKNKDWSAGGTLTLLEQYNGLGYANRGLPSPYVWAGTDQYKSGKYTSDGKFNPTVVDSQLGCAGLLMSMMVLDPTITFTGLTLTPAPPPQPSSFSTIMSLFRRPTTSG